MKLTLDDSFLGKNFRKLTAPNTLHWHRQPLHTVYGGAQIFSRETHTKLGKIALGSFQETAPNAKELCRIAHISLELAKKIHPRILAKLNTEPVEDFRIDFEDGYGVRGDSEEDDHALKAADELGEALRAGAASPYTGIRIKALKAQTMKRGLRTLDLFISRFCETKRQKFPWPFLITLPKVEQDVEVEILVAALSELEKKLDLGPRTFSIELMIETPFAIIDENGSCPMKRWSRLCAGRLFAVHLGAYDYTAALEISARSQRLQHPANDMARLFMKNVFSNTGIHTSDGATTKLPVGIHRSQSNKKLTSRQKLENKNAIESAWKESLDDIRHSLDSGFYQGWDLHPAQIPIRYAAVFAYFVEAAPEMALRLRSFVERATQATLVGNTFDDAATGQGLLNFFLRGLGCGALREADFANAGITHAELHCRSFWQIIEGRRGV